MKQIRGNRIVLYAGILAVILIFVSAITLTYSKYKQQPATKDGVVSAESFYFASDILKDVSENKTYDIYAWESGIEIKFMNYADAVQVAKDQVKYTISTTSGTIEDKAGTQVTEQTLTGGEKSEHSVWLKMNTPITQETTITVTAKSKPYEKTLKATFILHPMKSASYKIIDSLDSPTASLYIAGDAQTRTIQLECASEIFPDATNTALNENKITLQAKESCMILLFKSDLSKSYNLGDTVIVGDQIKIQ